MIVAISEMISDLPDENLNPTISTRASKKGTAASNAYNMILSISAALPGSILFISGPAVRASVPLLYSCVNPTPDPAFTT